MLGVGQIGVDEASHPLDIFGPIVQQATEAFTQPGTDTVHDAVPGLSIFHATRHAAPPDD